MIRVRTLVCILFLAHTAMIAHSQESQLPPEAEPASGQTRLLYGIGSSPLYYKLSVTADFGSDNYNKQLLGHVEYGLESTASGNYQIAFLGELKSSPRSPRIYEYAHPIFRLGPPAGFVSALLNVATIQPTGEIVHVESPRWIMGLPVAAGRLPFPPLRSEKQWKTEEAVSLVRNVNYSSYLQLLPVSPAIRDRFSEPSIRLGRGEESGQAVALLQTEWTLTERTPAQAVFQQTYSLDGRNFKPAIVVRGDGKIVFSIAQQSVDSVTQTYRVTWTEPQQSVTVVYSIDLQRMSDDEVAEYTKSKEARQEQLRKASAERAAMLSELPGLDDRQTLIEALRQADYERFRLLTTQLNSGVKETRDAELAKVIYQQFFRFGKVDYLAAQAIKKLEPQMEKTISLLESYSSSGFDVALTGDAIAEDVPLKRNQLVCYPSNIRWKAGFYYGAVDHVLVLESIDLPRKLIAVKREDCRLPLRGFLDPTLDDSHGERMQ
ncbi:MAG: hypothetical protein KJ000_15805 [Pirellulaceae bacterium]|nr:hypothetical protein [Pirellulaceae bacterium]